MSVLLNAVKLSLLSLTGLGFYLTWYLIMNNGAAEMMGHVHDRGPHVLPFTDEAPLKKCYIGIAPVDYQLTALTLFFYNVVDGSHPHASLQAYHFGGQIAAGWGLLVLESLRNSNRWRAISFITVWGLVMQNAALAVVIPVYLALHLSTSSTVSSRKPSDFLLDVPRLTSIPYSIAIGFLLPAAALALPAPSVISHETKQGLIGFWQGFPLWVGLLQEIIPAIQRLLIGDVAAEQTRKQSLGSLRTVYAALLAIAAVTRISTWTISFSSILFPSLIAKDLRHLLAPSAVFGPAAVTGSVKMPSIAAGAMQFLQYDEMIGAATFLLWSATLYVNVTEKKSLGGWASLIVRSIAVAALAGPYGFAVAAIWARDEVILASGDDTDKKDI
ncbi:MAG: hypothetical protein LQ345_006141 [Seirophora villosa]|nr:MAG: hypothetical protein LQ345_006141 [Seirophora villosa]